MTYGCVMNRGAIASVIEDRFNRRIKDYLLVIGIRIGKKRDFIEIIGLKSRKCSLTLFAVFSDFIGQKVSFAPAEGFFFWWCDLS